MNDPNVINPIVPRGQIVYDPVTGRGKLGDGHTPWLNLTFIPGGPAGPSGPAGPRGITGPVGPPGAVAVVSDVAYDATTWNGNTDVPTKNAVRDKFEALGSGSGDVVGPASSTDNAAARFDSTTGKLLQNGVVIISDTGVVSGVLSIAATEIINPTVTTKLNPTTDDGAPLGDTTHNFSDLFLATGALINWNNGNAVLTHGSGVLNVTTGDLKVTTAGTTSSSVATLGGTQTLQNKTHVAPILGTPASGTLTSCTGLPIVAGTTGTLSVARGGTNRTALGAALQVLRTNAGATDTEWGTPAGGGDALTADTLDQFADVTQTAGKTLAITDNTTLAGGTHSGTNTGDQDLSTYCTIGLAAGLAIALG